MAWHVKLPGLQRRYTSISQETQCENEILDYSDGGRDLSSARAGGGTSHLAMEYFRLETGTSLVHVPYKGTAPGLTDVVAGQVHVMISALPGTDVG